MAMFYYMCIRAINNKILLKINFFCWWNISWVVILIDAPFSYWKENKWSLYSEKDQISDQLFVSMIKSMTKWYQLCHVSSFTYKSHFVTDNWAIKEGSTLSFPGVKRAYHGGDLCFLVIREKFSLLNWVSPCMHWPLMNKSVHKLPWYMVYFAINSSDLSHLLSRSAVECFFIWPYLQEGGYRGSISGFPRKILCFSGFP